jgi:Holliday junction resolvase RusA-like endonuclease
MDNLPIIIELLGPPRGKGRPRFRVMGKFVSTYTDAETRKYEDRLKGEATLKMLGIPALDCALSVRIEAHMPIPQSWSKKNTEAAIGGRFMPITKPDSDNIVKMLDALNKVVWKDDSQIVSLFVLKRYSDNPRLRIVVWKWFDQ